MAITPEQVADLQTGDVIEMRYNGWPEGQRIVGPISDTGQFCGFTVASLSGSGDWWDLTVVSRAPRPLYVNHSRTSTWPGDVVRSADTVNNNQWMCTSRGSWIDLDGDVMGRTDLPQRLVLLVDGETGTVVR